MEVGNNPVASIENKKRKRAAKNRKKYWKKQCSIADVEEYLNDQRLQAKSGGPISQKLDEKLFFVDSKAKNKSQKSKTVKQRRKERIAKARCYESLNPDPDIDPVAVRRSQPLKVGSQKYTRKKNVEVRRLGRLKQIQADVQRMEVLEDRRARKKMAERERIEGATTTNTYYKLWEEADTAAPMKEEEFIEHTKPKPIKPPGHYFFKPSRLSAIELPPPGTSYNPTYEDHQKLLREVNAVEEKRAEAPKMSKQSFVKKVPREELERNWLEEMSVGLFDDKTPAAVVGDEVPQSVGSLSSTAVGPTQALKRRTKAARRHELVEKTRIMRMKKAKKLKLLSNDVYKLKSLKSDILKGETRHGEKMTRRRALRNSRLDDTKRLGPNKYVPPDQDFKMLSELKGSLRLLKPEGDMLYDRFKSFQKRNILRATVRAKVVKTKKKNRPKRVEKREVREVTL